MSGEGGFIENFVKVFSQRLPLVLLRSVALCCIPIYHLLKVKLCLGGREQGRIA